MLVQPLARLIFLQTFLGCVDIDAIPPSLFPDSRTTPIADDDTAADKWLQEITLDMFKPSSYTRALATMLSVTMCFPVFAARPNAVPAFQVEGAKRHTMELQLGADASLTGKLVDTQGKALAKVDVQVAGKHGRTIVRTDDNGVFRLTGVKVGEYSISVGSKTQIVRVWNAATAPPQAAKAALFVVGNTIRGQQHNSMFGPGNAAKAWIIGAGIAAAIAIPLALDDDDAS